ncbi:MAG TPA: SpoVA/SpoVAEb family sporulation membrane protein [Bacilli bacterium]|nr:SpoVA/SpoVAEb family sporulation membrane protein [Bacilli bacterium]
MNLYNKPLYAAILISLMISLSCSTLNNKDIENDDLFYQKGVIIEKKRRSNYFRTTLSPLYNIYDKFILWAGGGALVPITSFGHLIIHGAMESATTYGFMGLVMGMFSLTASGICSAIVFSFLLALIFDPKD